MSRIDDLARFADWAPAVGDRTGTFVPDRQDWYVVPCVRMRDSDELANSTFAAALAQLGGESETVEVHRCPHWAFGWIEVILVAPERRQDVAAVYAALDSEDPPDYECIHWDEV